MSDLAGASSSLVAIAGGPDQPDGDEPPSPGIRRRRLEHPPTPRLGRRARGPLERLAMAVAARRPPGQAACRADPVLGRRAAGARRRSKPSTSWRSRRITSRSSTPIRPPRPDPTPVRPLAPGDARRDGTEEDDPLDEDKDSPVPGLTHRYPDRVLLVTTHVCTMYCRFCTRKRATMKRGGWDSVSRDDRRMVEYVRDHPEIRDVIVSGGDPLTLPPEKLAFFVDNLSAIPHLDVIRIGTRVPVTLPQRLLRRRGDRDPRGARTRSGSRPISTTPARSPPRPPAACKPGSGWRGCRSTTTRSCLKGINDSLAVQRELCRALLRIKVRPYYLFHCDPVTGAGHFRTPGLEGDRDHRRVARPHLSGLGVPTYVVDAPRGGGKIPLMPNYLLSASNDSVVLRNYEGMIVHYHPTGDDSRRRRPRRDPGRQRPPRRPGRGLDPRVGNPRHAAKAGPAAPERQEGTGGNGNGNGNGHAPKGIES